ncbi:MAG: hypothetical protein KAG14_01770 [Mycoplasmataceae bacterium]|nr:hypothetical protein [Mycoplasmataceae bacterium]
MLLDTATDHLTIVQANKALDLIKIEYDKMAVKHDLAVFTIGIGTSATNSKMFVGAFEQVNTFIKASASTMATAKTNAANAIMALAIFVPAVSS